MAFTKPKTFFPSLFSSSFPKSPKQTLKSTKDEFIVSYMNKFGIDSLKQKTLIEKIFDNNFLKNDVNLKKLKRKFNDERRKRVCKTDQQIIDETTNLKKEENQISSKEGKEHLDNHMDNDNYENKKLKKKELIPGYIFNAQFSDYDNVSLDSFSTKSLYRVAEDEDEWTYLIKSDVEKFNKEKQDNLRKNKLKQNILKETLDRQVIEHQQLKEKDKQIDMNYHQILMENTRKEELNQREMLECEKKNVLLSKKELDNQNELKRRVRKIESLTELKDKQHYNDNAENQLNLEKNERILKRKRDLEVCRTMMWESHKNKQKKLEEDEEEKKKDILMQEVYLKDFEKLMKEREEEKIQRMEYIQKKYGTIASSFQKLSKKVDEEDRRQLKYFKLKEVEEKAEEEKRKKLIKEKTKFINNELSKQIKEKEELKLVETQINKEQANYWKKDTENYYKEVEEKKNFEKEKYRKYEKGLREQISPKNKSLETMNEEELLYNKPAFKMLSEGDAKIRKQSIFNRRKLPS